MFAAPSARAGDVGVDVASTFQPAMIIPAQRFEQISLPQITGIIPPQLTQICLRHSDLC